MKRFKKTRRVCRTVIAAASMVFPLPGLAAQERPGSTPSEALPENPSVVIDALDASLGIIEAQVEALAGLAPGSGVRLGRAHDLGVKIDESQWTRSVLGEVRLVPADLAEFLRNELDRAGQPNSDDAQFVFWLPIDAAGLAGSAIGPDGGLAVAPDSDESAPAAIEDLNRPSELDQKPQECSMDLTPLQAQAVLAAQIAGDYDPPGEAIAGGTALIAMKFHVVRSSSGSGGISAAQLSEAMRQLNNEFAEVGICFYQQLPTHFIDNNGYFTAVSGQAERDQLRRESPAPNCINVYWVPTLDGLCGESSFTFSEVQGIVMDNDCAGLSGNSATFAHEVGHYFDLLHTHETAIGNECVSGLNCIIAGDLVCDTPADPGLSSSNVNSSCVYTGTATGPCLFDGRYTPQPRNIMSYSRASCRNDFTPGQIDRAHSALHGARAHLIRSHLPTPSSPNASDGTFCDKVALSWSAASGSNNYEIYRSTSNSPCGGTLIASTTATSFNDTTASPGVTYFYSIRGVGTCGTTPCSGTNSGSRAVSVGVPTNVNASDSTSCDHVRVSWNNVAGAAAYRIYRGTTNVSSAAVRVSDVSASPFNDTSAVPGTNYFYWVRALGGCGEGPFSASNAGRRVPSTAPAAPLNVVASDTLCDRVVVSWNAVPGATGYRIYRNTVNNSATATQIALDDASAYEDLSAVNGTLYFYWVRASSPCATSAFSAPNSGISGVGIVPAVPTGLSATDGSSISAVVVSWTAVANATRYEIFRSAVNDPGRALRIGEAAAPPFNDTAAAPGAVNFYWVRAATPCTTSGFSASNSGYRALSPPAGVNATDQLGAPFITVSWQAVAGASHYRVFRGLSNSSSSAVALGTWQTGTAYVDSAATPGVTYFYFVRAAAGSVGERASAFSTSNSGRR